MIRRAKAADAPGIAALWQEAFGDPREAVTDFFAAFPRCRSYVAELDGEIAAMVHGLPQVLGPDLPAVYVYAVATAMSCRGRGLCRKLMAFAEQDWGASGFACAMLTPGEPSLFRFYEQMGYRADFVRKHTEFPGGMPVPVEEYARLRERVLTVPHVVYDAETLRYAQKIYGLTFWRTAVGCAAAGPDFCAEVLPGDLGGAPFAMVKWFSPPVSMKNAYLGFALE